MTLTSQNVLDALSTVIDPEIRRPITDLNMVDSINIDGSTVPSAHNDLRRRE